MTPDQMRIEIAERILPKWTQILQGERWHALIDGSWRTIPNYPYNLNAMHEAWSTLTDEQKKEFYYHLADLPEFCRASGTYVTTQKHLVLGATALQWAEAFCRATGDWKETP